MKVKVKEMNQPATENEEERKMRDRIEKLRQEECTRMLKPTDLLLSYMQSYADINLCKNINTLRATLHKTHPVSIASLYPASIASGVLTDAEIQQIATNKKQWEEYRAQKLQQQDHAHCKKATTTTDAVNDDNPRFKLTDFIIHNNATTSKLQHTYLKPTSGGWYISQKRRYNADDNDADDDAYENREMLYQKRKQEDEMDAQLPPNLRSKLPPKPTSSLYARDYYNKRASVYAEYNAKCSELIKHSMSTFTVQMFGRNEEGKTASIFVTDFKPFFFISVPTDTWNNAVHLPKLRKHFETLLCVERIKQLKLQQQDTCTFANNLMLWEQLLESPLIEVEDQHINASMGICDMQLVDYLRDLRGFRDGKRELFIYISFHNTAAFNFIKNLFYHETTDEEAGLGEVNNSNNCEAVDLDIMTRATKLHKSSVEDDTVTAAAAATTTEDATPKCKRLLPNGYRWNQMMVEMGPLHIYGAQIPPLLTFFHVHGISPSGWIQLLPLSTDNDNTLEESCVLELDGMEDFARMYKSNADHNYIVRSHQIQALDNYNASVPLLTASFDIECEGLGGEFPQAVKTYKKLAYYLVEMMNKWERHGSSNAECAFATVKDTMLFIHVIEQVFVDAFGFQRHILPKMDAHVQRILSWLQIPAMSYILRVSNDYELPCKQWYKHPDDMEFSATNPILSLKFLLQRIKDWLNSPVLLAMPSGKVKPPPRPTTSGSSSSRSSSRSSYYSGSSCNIVIHQIAVCKISQSFYMHLKQ